MSLSITLQSALSGLQTSQSALRITSNNIANANTEGYSRKVADPVSLVTAGQVSGVKLSDVERRVDEFLIRDLRTQGSALGQYSVRNDFYSRMQDLFGSPNGGGTLSATLGNLATAMERLAATPEDSALRQSVITAGQAFARTLNQSSAGIQTLRAEADQQITAALDIVNTNLEQIESLNREIAHNTATSRPVADLLDKRDQAVAAVAEQLDISTFTRTTGEMVIMTKGGRILLDGAAPTLTHSPAGAVDATITYPGGFDGIMLNGTDITTEIGSGRIAGLIEVRDESLPAMTEQLDELATTAGSTINAIHNDGTSVPAPSSLTGTRTVALADPVAGTGIARIAVTNSDGTLAAAPLDLDLTTVADVNDVVTAINAGLAGFATASVTNGRLVITATNAGDGIAINENTSSIGGLGFSHHFGLNDFFVGDPTTSSAGTLAVRSDLVSDPTYLARGELSMTAALAGDVAVSEGDGTVMQRIANAFDAAVGFGAAGGIPASTTTLAGYSARIISVNANRAADAKGDFQFKQAMIDDLSYRASSVSGVNIDEEMANLIVLQKAFNASARVVSVTSELYDVLTRLGAR